MFKFSFDHDLRPAPDHHHSPPYDPDCRPADRHAAHLLDDHVVHRLERDLQPRGVIAVANPTDSPSRSATECRVPHDVLSLCGDAVRVLKSVARERPGLRAVDESDLDAGVYEGGYKVWECTLDLIAYMHDNSAQFFPNDVSSPVSSILELGGGHCLPSLVLAKHCLGVRLIVLHDYNREVLEDVTVANVALNDVAMARCRFAYGPWGDALTDALRDTHTSPQQTFDLILSCDTLYCRDSLRDLARCVLRLLTPDTGTALIAAKSYYFGVGGGTAAFRTTLHGVACDELGMGMRFESDTGTGTTVRKDGAQQGNADGHEHDHDHDHDYNNNFNHGRSRAQLDANAKGTANSADSIGLGLELGHGHGHGHGDDGGCRRTVVCKRVHQIRDGLSNVREILSIRIVSPARPTTVVTD